MRMTSIKKHGLTAAFMASFVATAWAQGIPVIDVAAIAQAIQQLQQGMQQLQQLQQTHQSFNKLTSMGDIAAILNQPGIRQAMPKDFNAVSQALLGQGGTAQQRYDANTLYATTSSANTAYTAEIERQKRVTAGTQSVAQQLYDTTAQRAAGIDQLRQQIGQSEDPKTIMDLQARIASEQLAAQNDLAQIQAFKMLADAEDKVSAQHEKELSQQHMDAVIQSSRSGGQ